jgi:hypothetical protein
MIRHAEKEILAENKITPEDADLFRKPMLESTGTAQD